MTSETAAANTLRIISFVPSWTESLIEAGETVVGRTRFCIHPGHLVSEIAVVGGTKTLDLDKIRALKPDLVILDREENTLEMHKALERIEGLELHITHVQDVNDLAVEFERLAKRLSNAKLSEWAKRMRAALSAKAPKLHNDSFAGLLKWTTVAKLETKIVYVIWKSPWMAVGEKTFIASMLKQAGLTMTLWPLARGKYPEFTLEELPTGVTVLLSSEPYPFESLVSPAAPTKAPFDFARPTALIDGECFSWFGIRALRFLELAKGLKLSPPPKP